METKLNSGVAHTSYLAQERLKKKKKMCIENCGKVGEKRKRGDHGKRKRIGHNNPQHNRPKAHSL